jgi:hypothetical protein
MHNLDGGGGVEQRFEGVRCPDWHSACQLYLSPTSQQPQLICWGTISTGREFCAI